ncbi:hypothetical protein F4779DRAFT_491576 [Xylariaceae sp. FL0662B]|nr:hypothetical protein F4779DRAFT_491576 [Xylariaceae sp. FL0662B]
MKGLAIDDNRSTGTESVSANRTVIRNYLRYRTDDDPPDTQGKDANALPKKPLPISIIVVGIVSVLLNGFCWKLMFASFLVVYYYFHYLAASSFRLPQGVSVFSAQAMNFVILKAFQIMLLTAFILWSVSVSPVHIFMPTLMDSFTPYAIHEPLA